MGFNWVADYRDGKMDWFLHGLPVEGELAGTVRAVDVVEDVSTCHPHELVAQVRGRLGDGDVCIVVNDARVVLGALPPGDTVGDDQRVAGELMRPGPSTFRPGVAAEELARHLRERGQTWAVLTTAEGRLSGIVSAESLERVSG